MSQRGVDQFVIVHSFTFDTWRHVRAPADVQTHGFAALGLRVSFRPH